MKNFVKINFNQIEAFNPALLKDKYRGDILIMIECPENFSAEDYEKVVEHYKHIRQEYPRSRIQLKIPGNDPTSKDYNDQLDNLFLILNRESQENKEAREVLHPPQVKEIKYTKEDSQIEKAKQDMLKGKKGRVTVQQQKQQQQTQQQQQQSQKRRPPREKEFPPFPRLELIQPYDHLHQEETTDKAHIIQDLGAQYPDEDLVKIWENLVSPHDELLNPEHREKQGTPQKISIKALKKIIPLKQNFQDGLFWHNLPEGFYLEKNDTNEIVLYYDEHKDTNPTPLAVGIEKQPGHVIGTWEQLCVDKEGAPPLSQKEKDDYKKY